ncbi:uncharacterized protein LOC127725431 isoform X2 [Mytilus californianus]|uniref:uncharacterized protein LOC127725431 isoform X2 n=1 Tax=Mytilus californianus TaxID=6549 RepID=UPI00224535CE|nr:uncharacterized protein LOC127725431 isoform X2 [Mytilus californianus]XP_052088346.1 uncharacterized protein LOC127725431 isoform X2 [Mytilus californianus]
MLLKMSDVLIIITLVSVGICTSTLVANVSEECFGNTHSNFLFPSCFSGQVMYVHDVYSYAKTLDSRCPQIQTSNVNASEGCCAYYNATEDCGMRYYGPNGDLTIYSDCSGSVSCQKAVGWNDTIKECNQSVFLPQTNYMQLNYHCIEEIEICSICSCNASGTSLYIWNGEYPNAMNDCSLTSGCSCSITSSSQIQLIAFDVRFKMNSTTGDCAQRLHIQDDESEFDIACDDQNAFEKRTAYISTSNRIKLRLDNSLEVSNGYFWIQVQAFDGTDTLTLTCGKENATYGCNDNFTIISENVTEFILPEKDRRDSAAESGNSGGIGTIIGVVVAMIVLVAMALLAFKLWKRYKDKHTKVDPKPDPKTDTDDDDMFNNNDQTPITSRAPESVLIRMKTNV